MHANYLVQLSAVCLLMTGGFALGGCRAPGSSPKSASPAAQKNADPAPRPIDVTVDIGDDFWRSRGRLSESNIREQMQRFAELGLRRVYWLVVPNLRTTGLVLREDGDGFAALRTVIEAAHDAGLEFFPIFKPFETGNVGASAPHNASLPPGSMRGETLTGPTTQLSDFLVDQPEYRTWRRPGWDAGDAMVASIKLVNRGPTTIDLAAEDLVLWTSPINGEFVRYEDPFGLQRSRELRDGKEVAVLTLTGLHIPATERYLLLTCSREDPSASLRNRSSALVELYDGDGAAIPDTWDQGPYTRDMLMTRLQRAWLKARGAWGVPEEALPPADYGASPDRQGYAFEIGRGDSVRTLDSLDKGQGYICTVRGKPGCMNIPQPLHPEVRAWWLDQVRRMVDCGIDGIDIRVCNHSAWLSEPEAYGFGPVVQQAYRERYGEELLSEAFDEQRWKRLQGDAYTAFLREARELTRDAGIPMQLHVNAVMGTKISYWTRNNVPAHIEWQWRRWIGQDLCDSVLLKYLPWWWGSAAGEGADFAEEVIRTARAAGDQAVWEWRFDCWWLTTNRPVNKEFTQADLQRLLRRRTWGWQRDDLAAITLYEGFNFIYMDPDNGTAKVSPAFRDILAAVRDGKADTLEAADLDTYAGPES